MFQILVVQVFDLIGIGVVGGGEEKDDLGVQDLFLVVIRHSVAIGLHFTQMGDDIVHSLQFVHQLGCSLYADPTHRAVVVSSGEDGALQPANVVQLQELLQEETVHIARRPLIQVNVIAVSILRHLQHHPHPIRHQVRILSDSEICEAQLDQLGYLTVGLVRGDHKLDVLGVECSHGGGDYAFIDDDTAREVLPSFLLITDFKIVQSTLLVLLLIAFSFVQGLLLFAHVFAVEYADRAYLVVDEQVEHFEYVVEVVVGVDVLVEFEGAAVAPLVQPRHDVHHCCLSLEAADVFPSGDWSKEFQKTLDSHWRQFIIIKSNKIQPFQIPFRLIPITYKRTLKQEAEKIQFCLKLGYGSQGLFGFINGCKSIPIFMRKHESILNALFQCFDGLMSSSYR